MASRAIGGVAVGGRGAPVADWRAAFRRSMARAGQLAGAGLLFAGMLFLGLALVSYRQTDPSLSTAAASTARNWMGVPGAYAADGALLLFGLAAALLLPLLYAFASKLWRDAEAAETPHGRRWWQTVALLLLAIVLLATVLALAFEEVDGLPASTGGLAGLLGAAAIEGLAGLLPLVARGWAVLAAALACLVGGLYLAGRVFAFDWQHLLTLPRALGRYRPARRVRANSDAADDEELEDEDEAPRPARTRKRSTAMPLDPEADDGGEPGRRAPEIADQRRAPLQSAKPQVQQQQDLFDNVALPALDLLADPPPDNAPEIDKLALERNARLLENVLDDFNVKGEITAVRTGPVVTMYELEPAPGTKAVRVIGLAEDIARNMSAISARVSSIPGRTVMGIELPNADRQMVSFKELVASAAFADAKGNLPIILGKDIAGEPVVADLAAMPHLLVAGTTGSGKSVGLNGILISLLYRFTPAECRMILIDPKVLELSVYNDIPHLLSPVVVDPPKAIRALKWAVEEMERRYRMMSSIGARNLAGFNERIRAAAARGKPLGRRVQTGFDPDTGEELFEEEQLDYEVLPQIVLIVDELADLMVTVGKEVEVLIQRLSQKSRAAGIHLIMATQRPSVDVITGVIKANLPTRISFNVTSRIDSRTILGEHGAEQLLGKGDMLFKSGSAALRRVHGPFLSDEEVERVSAHWRAQGKPVYVDSVTEEPAEGGFGFDDELTASDDPEERKYRQACQIVFEAQRASGSWIQRQMGVGYNTAAKWIERMEEDGFVGPANHLGRREIFRDTDGNPL
ncbi:DNA translocase FtsK 4TM domain-containing protein [Croceibacterium sp. TMG7-5b_MA50]|uniref:FtsK/SpoIIIE family DNA translocase n=1 Tax=Croceibacterium sp. TMG7-5b_MA50 TaxID=3121290 RepID=UPI003221A794